jgi:hypothetical protein
VILPWPFHNQLRLFIIFLRSKWFLQLLKFSFEIADGKWKLIKKTERQIYKNHFLNRINVYFNFYDEKKRKNGISKFKKINLNALSQT